MLAYLAKQCGRGFGWSRTVCAIYHDFTSATMPTLAEQLSEDEGPAIGPAPIGQRIDSMLPLRLIASTSWR